MEDRKETTTTTSTKEKSNARTPRRKTLPHTYRKQGNERHTERERERKGTKKDEITTSISTYDLIY